MTLLRGLVRSGKGDFSFWLAKLEPYYTQKTGMKLYPGTLNIHLSDAIFPTPKDAIPLEKEEYGGRVSVSMAPCRIFGRKAFILRPDTDDGKFGDPPERILEVATDVGIKDTYGVKDRDIVEVEVSDADMPAHSRLQILMTARPNHVMQLTGSM